MVADRYVFACGPWLGKLFPKTVGPHFISTKQDVFFFAPPPAIRFMKKVPCRCGPITAITSCMEFQEIRIAASNWPMTRAVRSSTRLPESD